ncbi:MAG TPA: 3'-5' exonuclease [Lachnospiraceae bacterium]|nr:3'-5' exonuclease [Lachnospiraceae bacterium]
MLVYEGEEMMKCGEYLKKYKSIIVFDCETNGLDFNTCQIIELAAIKIGIDINGDMFVEKEFDKFISLPEGKRLPSKIIELTGISDNMLKNEGFAKDVIAREFLELVDGSTLLIAHNAQFDALFLLSLLKGYDFPSFDYLDTLTIFKDRRAYPHKLSDAIIAYGLENKVINSHRAIDDVCALMEVLKEMIMERDDIHTYINIFGYNPKFGVSGKKITGIQYAAHKYNNDMTDENNTLPALLDKKQDVYTQLSFGSDLI